MKKIQSYFFLLFIVLLSCNQDRARLDANGIPKKLLIGVFGGDGPDETLTRHVGVAAYLEKKLKIPVEIILTSDYTAAIEALRAKKIHMAYLEPFSYALASKQGNLFPMVAIGRNGKPYMYKSILIASHSSGIKTMEDVKAKAKSLTLCFTDPASASGHLIPRAYLMSIGLDPKTDFKETVFASSHTAAIMSVESGKTDLGCTLEIGLDKLIKKGIVEKDDFVVLWESDPIVSSPVVIRKDINAAFSKKVQRAYLDLPKEDPEAWFQYTKIVAGRADSDSLMYMVAYDSLYNGLRKIVSNLKEL